MTGTASAASMPITEQVRATLKAAEVILPPFPRIGARLLELLQDEDRADAGAIAALVRNDPAITAALLKLANSAAFGGLSPARDPRQAISRLGLRRVNSLITTLVMKGHFTAAAGCNRKVQETLWDHSVATALAARIIVASGAGDAEEAYLAGLLHDVGKLLVLKAIDHLEHQRPELEFTPEVAEELLAVLHPRVGHDVLRQWRLPESICLASLRHHDQDLAPDEVLVVRVQAANALAHRLTEDKARPAVPLEETPAVQRLNLTDMELACLLVDLEDEMTRVRQLI